MPDVARLGRAVLRLVRRVVVEQVLVRDLDVLRDLGEELLLQERRLEGLQKCLARVALRLQRLLVLLALALERVLDQPRLGLVEILLRDLEPELVRRAPELLELDQVRRRTASRIAGTRELPASANSSLPRLVSLLCLADELVELLLRDLRPVDDGDSPGRDAAVGASAPDCGERGGRDECGEYETRGKLMKARPL